MVIDTGNKEATLQYLYKGPKHEGAVEMGFPTGRVKLTLALESRRLVALGNA